jgi:hypothetical protein
VQTNNPKTYACPIFHHFFPQGGVSTVAWVLGHQIFDLLGLLLQPALMFAWLYVLTLPSVAALTYYSTLALVGWYTSSLGYLVSTMTWLFTCCIDACCGTGPGHHGML